MAKMNCKVRLQKLLDNELSSPSNDKNQVISGYKSLIDILKIPQLGQHLHNCHELLFECISQIILTPLNQVFDDDQLRLVLESASNACVLSMSQNQIIDGWLQNIEERVFEKPDDDDDDDLYEDVTESEEEEEEEKVITIRDNKKISTCDERSQHPQKHVCIDDSNSASSKEKNPSLIQPISNQRNAHVAHSHGHRGGHHEIIETSTRGARNNPSKGSDNGRGRGRRAPPFDNKYGVDLRLYDCYICGEYGHVRYDCPMKQSASRGATRAGLNNKKVPNRSKSSSSSSSVETIPSETDQNKMQQVYNHSSKLLNSSQTTDERNQTFESLLSLIKKLQNHHGENLSKLFLEKESLFYPLFCHIAQNDFLFTNDQYIKLYHLKAILLPKKQHLLNKDRSIFSRQRPLTPLDDITKHIHNNKQIQQTIFNDFQEYVTRSPSPISIMLFDLIKYLLKSNIHIDIQCLEYFTQRILFDLKKDIFSNEQLYELHSYLDIRTKRLERNDHKQIWKERLTLFKNDKLAVELNQWIEEFEQILKTNSTEPKESPVVVLDHAMWYFAVLLMASSGHLNKEQYEYLLKAAIQSSLFNSIQKYYFQVYLNQGQAPIMINELKEIKVRLASNNIDDKKLAYEQLQRILDRSKPEYNNEKIQQPSVKINDQSRKTEDIVPIIDNHVLLRLISLVEMICLDPNTFSNEQCTELLDKFLQQSTIVRPLSNTDQQRLKSYYSCPVSLNELKILCSTLQSGLNDFLHLLKHRTLIKNDEIFDFLTQTIVNIFENHRKFSNEKCQELKSLIEKPTYGKQRYRRITEAYQKFRITKKVLPSINPILLNQLLSNILLQDYQAHLEFFTLLEELPQILDFKQITTEFEINRCLLSTIILVISEVKDSNSSNTDFFRQRLKSIIEKKTNFFSLLLTDQQYQLLLSRLALTSNLDSLIDSIKTNFNEKNLSNLIDFIQNDLKDKTDFDKMINFILYTFDNEFLSIEQTLQISNLIIQHPKFSKKTMKNILQFLMELLQLNIHSSPKIFRNLIENHQDDNQTINQIIIMLKAQNGNYAVADWKRIMIELLFSLFDRQENYEQLRDIARQSPMFQTAKFQQQLESYGKKSTENQSQPEEKKEPSAIPKHTDTNDQSFAHHEMFRYLESNDASMNALVIQQLRAYLLDEKLPTEISLPEFIQALQIVFKNAEKFAEVSLNEWALLVENNRGKIFSNDAQCDQLLMNILFSRFNMPIDTLDSLHRLIQSKKAPERHDGLQKLLVILKNTQINNDKNQANNLPTISNQLYSTITQVVFDQQFNNTQVRQCLSAGRNSSLLNNDHRQKLNDI